MAGRCSLLPLARLLLLVVVLGAVLHCNGAVARPLLGIAEPPASPGAVAEGPGDDAARAGAGGRPDRSEAGGEVILAGFAAAVIIVVFCYIRVTREKSSSGGGGGVGEGEKQESLGAF
ncbi:hypothetical protein SEVIR_9G197400v4 [Setaria viridis]|nr:uncharacterized protein LOC101784837 [Setaria italica]XP_034576098.1 uncharacterized protein LOC117839788 [Setaria viridis]RCV42207.1 hypothetical protein SETIT_9G197900v2 [Setaria italica]TKV92984.1 hypothetical protein SEVIR_9G197400v2 [Setaria viridis]